MTEQIKKTRDNTFDSIKGILIFLVVLGHAIQMSGSGDFTQNPINTWIYSFHMPMFIFIAGFFSKRVVNSPFKECLISRSKRLLLPAFVWTIIALCYNVFVDHQAFNVQVVIHSIHNIWFLYCLFGLTIVANIVWKTKHPVFWSITIALFLLIIYPYNKIPLFRQLQFTRQWPEFLLGLLLLSRLNISNYLKNKGNKYWIMMVGMIIMIAIYIGWYWKAGLEHDPGYVFDSKNYILRIIIQMISTILFFNIFYIVCKKIGRNLLTKLGGVTMAVYLIHPYVIDAILSLDIETNLFTQFCISIVATLISVGIYQLFKKFKNLSPYMFGE